MRQSPVKSRASILLDFVASLSLLPPPPRPHKIAVLVTSHFTFYRGADKSLARPGSKQVTATKPFYKPIKNNSEFCPSNQISAAAMTSASAQKMTTFQLLFFSLVGLRTYQHSGSMSPMKAASVFKQCQLTAPLISTTGGS